MRALALVALTFLLAGGCHIYVAPTVYQQNCTDVAAAPDVDGLDVLRDVVEMTNGAIEETERR